MSRTVTQQEPDADGLVALTLKKPDGKEDTYRVPPIFDLEADLTADLMQYSIEFWMAKFLTRHAPELAKKVRRTQLVALFQAYVGDDEATPGESEASPES